jgi:hypothetical protein
MVSLYPDPGTLSFYVQQGIKLFVLSYEFPFVGLFKRPAAQNDHYEIRGHLF